jgi:hypothetical protein
LSSASWCNSGSKVRGVFQSLTRFPFRKNHGTQRWPALPQLLSKNLTLYASVFSG